MLRVLRVPFIVIMFRLLRLRIDVQVVVLALTEDVKDLKCVSSTALASTLQSVALLGELEGQAGHLQFRSRHHQTCLR